jgi:hypothetical protein
MNYESQSGRYPRTCHCEEVEDEAISNVAGSEIASLPHCVRVLAMTADLVSGFSLRSEPDLLFLTAMMNGQVTFHYDLTEL